MRKRILSILLCLVMVVGLFPTMAFAADGSGATTGRGTKTDPYCVSTYAEMKRLLERSASSYIKVVGMDNDSDVGGVPIHRLIAGRDFESTEPAIDIPSGANHHLEIATDIWFVADPLDGDKNIFGRLIDLVYGSSLEITGTGSLRLEVNALTVKNAIIDNWGGELTIDGSVTLNGFQDFTTNVATRPIWIDGGVTNIKGGYIYGHNNMKTTSDAVTSAISFGNNLADGTELNISGGTIKQVNNSINQGNENSCALYVDNDTVANAIHLTGGTFEGGMKMKTDKPLSNLLSAGYQFYDMSANAFFDGSVSKTQKKLTVTPTGVNPTVIDKVSLNIKSLNKRKTLSDLECGYDPSSKMTLTDFVVCKGLNNTTDKIEGKNTPYDLHQDYTAMYTFEAGRSYSFADTVENQVSVSGGDFWKADILDGSTKKLCVFVNFPSNQVKEVSMTMKSKGDFKTIEDLKCQSFVPDDKLELVNQMFFAGLKDTSNEHQIEDLKTAYQPAADYTGFYVFKLKPGFSFAQDITDLAKKHVTISEGEIYNVDTMKNKDGAMLLRVFVSFEGTGSSISNVHLNFKPVGVRHQIADMSPVNWTPGEETLKLYNVCYYDGADTDADAKKLENIEAAYDRNKAYSVSFQLIGEMGAVFADGFDKNSITLSDGKVWKVQRINKSKMVICVTFPASGDTATKINAVGLTIKPYDQRHDLVDFVPTAITPEGMSVTSTNIYKDGTLYTGSYDANTAYSVGYSLNTKSGYAFENGFEKENVTVSNGTVQSVNVINNNYVIVYVDFPKDPTTDPNYVTEAAVQIAAPVAGEKPKGTVDIPVLGDNKDKVKKATMWWSGMLSGKTAFVAGQEYTAIVELAPKEGVTFADNMKLKVNGKAADLLSKDPTDGSVQFKVKFTAVAPSTDPNYVTEAAVQIVAPVAGEKPKGTVDIPVLGDNKDKVKKATMWWSGMLSGKTAFVAGQEYTAIVELAPKEGVTFADNMKLKVNGKAADLLSKDPTDGSVQFKVKFTATGSTHTHSYGTDWKYDNTNHWHECECGDKADVAAHSASEWIVDTAATETADGAKHKECTVCKKVLETATIPATGSTHTHSYNQETVKPEALKTPADCTGNAVYFKSCSCGAISTTDAFVAMNTALGHAYGSDWKYDSTNHWHECSRCHDKKDEAAHDYGSDNVCDTCGYDKTVPHTHNLTLVAAKAATCTTAGNSAYYTCDGCDKWFADATGSVEITDKTSVKIPAPGHTAGTEWKSDDTNHWHECTVAGCGVIIESTKSAHTAGEWIVDTPATATTAGTKHKECTVCKKVIETATIPATGSGSTGGGGGGSSVTTYAITVKSAKNGDVTASRKSASKGTTVTLTVDPDKGYVLDTLTVLDGKDKEIKLTEKNGKYTFTMPASKVTVAATFKASAPTGKNPFIDVPAGSYYEDAVVWAVEKGITSGTSAVTFDPNGNCTRAQAVTFLWRAAGSPAPKTKVMPFADVKAGSYYYDAVLWAVEQGITKGASDTMFSPDATCTRAQIVTFLWRANGSPAVSGNSAFTDVASDAYYAAAVTWAEKNGVTGGIGGGLFGSNNNCTRAQIVTFIYRSVK